MGELANDCEAELWFKDIDNGPWNEKSKDETDSSTQDTDETH